MNGDVLEPFASMKAPVVEATRVVVRRVLLPRREPAVADGRHLDVNGEAAADGATRRIEHDTVAAAHARDDGIHDVLAASRSGAPITRKVSPSAATSTLPKPGITSKKLASTREPSWRMRCATMPIAYGQVTR